MSTIADPTIAEQEPLLPGVADSEQQAPKPEVSKVDAIAMDSAVLSAGVFVVITWVIILTNNPTSSGWFPVHPLLMSSAIALFTYGILTLQPTSQPSTKKAGLARHQIAMLYAGYPVALLGAIAIIYNKAIHGAYHFTSWHSKFGLITLIWITLQILIGAGSVWYGGAAFGGGDKAKAVYKYHRISGYLIFPMLLLTAHLAGAWSDWVTGHSKFFVRVIAYTVAPLILLISVYTRARPSKMKFW